MMKKKKRMSNDDWVFSQRIKDKTREELIEEVTRRRNHSIIALNLCLGLFLIGIFLGIYFADESVTSKTELLNNMVDKLCMETYGNHAFYYLPVKSTALIYCDDGTINVEVRPFAEQHD